MRQGDTYDQKERKDTNNMKEIERAVGQGVGMGERESLGAREGEGQRSLYS